MVQPDILGCFPKTAVKLLVLSLKKLYLEMMFACGMPAYCSLSGGQDLKRIGYRSVKFLGRGEGRTN